MQFLHHVNLLTKCFPSMVMKQIPLQILLPEAELFIVDAKVFSYVCFVHLLGLEQDKLEH